MKADLCPHCLTEYSDERDENGNRFCECDGATITKLRIDLDEALIYIENLERDIKLKNNMVDKMILLTDLQNQQIIELKEKIKSLESENEKKRAR